MGGIDETMMYVYPRKVVEWLRITPEVQFKKPGIISRLPADTDGVEATPTLSDIAAQTAKRWDQKLREAGAA